MQHPNYVYIVFQQKANRAPELYDVCTCRAACDLVIEEARKELIANGQWWDNTFFVKRHYVTTIEDILTPKYKTA